MGWLGGWLLALIDTWDLELAFGDGVLRHCWKLGMAWMGVGGTLHVIAMDHHRVGVFGVG
jgi:hypothetical protein